MTKQFSKPKKWCWNKRRRSYLHFSQVFELTSAKVILGARNWISILRPKVSVLDKRSSQDLSRRPLLRILTFAKLHFSVLNMLNDVQSKVWHNTASFAMMSLAVTAFDIMMFTLLTLPF